MSDTTVAVQRLLGQLGDGDAARWELVQRAYHRLELLARSQLRRFGRADDAQDALHAALPKLGAALRTVRPESPRHFYALAARHIRWALLDATARRRAAEDAPDPVDSADGPATLTERADTHERLHRAVDELPDELRLVVDLVFYHGLTQADAAAVLGVSDRTVKKRWRDARLKLFDVMGEPAVVDPGADRVDGEAGT